MLGACSGPGGQNGAGKPRNVVREGLGWVEHSHTESSSITNPPRHRFSTQPPVGPGRTVRLFLRFGRRTWASRDSALWRVSGLAPREVHLPFGSAASGPASAAANRQPASCMVRRRGRKRGSVPLQTGVLRPDTDIGSRRNFRVLPEQVWVLAGQCWILVQCIMSALGECTCSCEWPRREGAAACLASRRLHQAVHELLHVQISVRCSCPGSRYTKKDVGQEAFGRRQQQRLLEPAGSSLAQKLLWRKHLRKCRAARGAHVPRSECGAWLGSSKSGGVCLPRCSGVPAAARIR